jgi:hypothetical protein
MEVSPRVPVGVQVEAPVLVPVGSICSQFWSQWSQSDRPRTYVRPANGMCTRSDFFGNVVGLWDHRDQRIIIPPQDPNWGPPFG